MDLRLTKAERDIIEHAIQELEDIAVFGTEDELDAGVVGTPPLDQVEATREAVAQAMKVVTKFRRRAVKAGHD